MMVRPYDSGLGLVFCRMAMDLLHGRYPSTACWEKVSTFAIVLPTDA
ncbi:MAG: hypothetical protein H0W78_16370 [Planctomycetes bacterium]|jgi:hypothetical protein|nr:hypothetical protein [Planctomycetota bacterium]